MLGAVHFHLVAWYLALLAGAGVETPERALRERIVWRGERVPVGVSGPPGLHLIVEEGRTTQLSLSRLPSLQLVPVRLFGTGQAAHIHEEKKRGGRRSGSNRCFGHSVDSLLSCWQKQGFRPVLPTIGFEPMTLAV